MSYKTSVKKITILLPLLVATALLMAACNKTPAPTATAPAAATPTTAATVTINTPTPQPTPNPTAAAKQDDEELPMAIDFTASNLFTGQELSLNDYRGKIVFLNFWGSWCPPCRAEMPAFEEVYEQYKDNNVVIIGVGVNDSEDNLLKFAKSINITYPIVWDRGNQIARQYHIRSLPTTYRINPKGQIQGVAQGGLNKEQLIQAIEELR